MNAPRAIILALFAAGSVMSMPLQHTAGGPSSQLSRRDNPELSTKEQQWAYQIRAADSGYESSVGSLNAKGQRKVEKKAGRLQKKIAHDENMPDTKTPGTGVFTRIDYLAEDNNAVKLHLNHHKLKDLEHLQNKVTDEVSKQQRKDRTDKRSLRARSPHKDQPQIEEGVTPVLNAKQQDYVYAARQRVQNWDQGAASLDSHGQKEERKEVADYVKELTKKEGKPYVSEPGMGIFVEANDSLQDNNASQLPTNDLKPGHRLNFESKKVDRKIAHEEKHHSETVAAAR